MSCPLVSQVRLECLVRGVTDPESAADTEREESRSEWAPDTRGIISNEIRVRSMNSCHIWLIIL